MTRRTWGGEDGVPVGSHFRLSAELLLDGKPNTSALSGAAITLTVADTALNNGTALMTNETTDCVTNDNVTIAHWDIFNTQSSSWEAGTYDGDIKAVLADSGSSVRYWPVRLRLRAVKD